MLFHLVHLLAAVLLTPLRREPSSNVVVAGTIDTNELVGASQPVQQGPQIQGNHTEQQQPLPAKQGFKSPPWPDKPVLMMNASSPRTSD
jgi:hypothetical protein